MSIQQIEYTSAEAGWSWDGTGFDPNFVHDPATGVTGIGTQTPNKMLDVNDPANEICGIFQGNSAGAIGLGSLSGIGIIQGYTDDTASAISNFSLQPSGGNLGVGTLTPAHTLDIAGTLNVSGNTTIGGTLAVSGNTSLDGTLVVSGNTTLDGTLVVSDDTTIDGTLIVAALAVSGSTTLNGALVNGTFNATGNATLGGTLTVTSNESVGGTLGVTGNSTIGGTLAVASTINANATGVNISLAAAGGITAVGTVGGIAGLYSGAGQFNVDNNGNINAYHTLSGPLSVDASGNTTATSLKLSGSGTPASGTLQATDVVLDGSVGALKFGSFVSSFAGSLYPSGTGVIVNANQYDLNGSVFIDNSGNMSFAASAAFSELVTCSGGLSSPSGINCGSAAVDSGSIACTGNATIGGTLYVDTIQITSNIYAASGYGISDTIALQTTSSGGHLTSVQFISGNTGAVFSAFTVSLGVIINE